MSYFDFIRGLVAATPAPISVSVASTATGPVATYTRKLNASSALSASLNANHTFNTTTGVLSATAALGSASQTSTITESYNGVSISIPITVTGVVTPTVPAAPTLTVVAGNGQNTLSWTDGSNGGATITAHKLYRGTASGGETLLGTITSGSPYVDTGLTNGTTYYYKLSAVNSVGEGALSSEVSGKPSAAPSRLLAGSRFNQMGFGGYAGSNGTDTSSNFRLGSYNETGATITKLQVYHTNWMANSTNEQDGYNAITVTASIEYPAGTFNQVTWSAATSVSIPATGANLAESDQITLATPIPAGALFWVRTYVSVTSGQKWVQGYLVDSASPNLSEAADFSTGVDLTMSGSIVNATPTANRRGYGPSAVVATGFSGTPVSKAFAGVGDSLIMGSTDVGDSAAVGHGNIGYLGKALATNYPFLNLGIAGTAAFNNLPANFTRRAALLAKAGITHIYCDWSINDTNAGQTAAQQQSNIAAIAAGFKSAVPGVKVIYATQCPYTTGTYLTAAGQTIKTTPTGAFTGGSSSVRGQINAAIRAGISGVDIAFDPAASVEVNSSNVLTQDGGYWISGNAGVGATSTHLTTTGASTDGATVDGLHPAGTSTTSPGYGGTYILRDAVRAAMAGW